MSKLKLPKPKRLIERKTFLYSTGEIVIIADYTGKYRKHLFDRNHE